MKLNFCPKKFSNLPCQKLLDLFKHFSNSFPHGGRGKYRDLIKEISTLVKTAL